MDNVIPLPEPLPPGIDPPLAIRVATVEGLGRWFVEFHYPVTRTGPRWAPGAPQESPDYATEAEAAEVADWLARGWRRPVEATVIHPANRAPNFRSHDVVEPIGGAA